MPLYKLDPLTSWLLRTLGFPTPEVVIALGLILLFLGIIFFRTIRSREGWLEIESASE